MNDYSVFILGISALCWYPDALGWNIARGQHQTAANTCILPLGSCKADTPQEKCFSLMSTNLGVNIGSLYQDFSVVLPSLM